MWQICVSPSPLLHRLARGLGVQQGIQSSHDEKAAIFAVYQEGWEVCCCLLDYHSFCSLASLMKRCLLTRHSHLRWFLCHQCPCHSNLTTWMRLTSSVNPPCPGGGTASHPTHAGVSFHHCGNLSVEKTMTRWIVYLIWQDARVAPLKRVLSHRFESIHFISVQFNFHPALLWSVSIMSGFCGRCACFTSESRLSTDTVQRLQADSLQQGPDGTRGAHFHPKCVGLCVCDAHGIHMHTYCMQTHKWMRVYAWRACASIFFWDCVTGFRFTVAWACACICCLLWVCSSWAVVCVTEVKELESMVQCAVLLAHCMASIPIWTISTVR